ncbi:sensor histidine kinase [Clostridium chrysemydis]|uniref:sensor histidine kinase n=1 Tax=Clostridium chrysemydis TaxID=2665504 RepID=UPI0018841ECE|nr:HAMP domain-containing sensor histidine kinase [Clostridium chrysemydis]
MPRINFKSGIIIIIYSLVLALILGIGVFFVRGSFNNVENKMIGYNKKAFIISSVVGSETEPASIYNNESSLTARIQTIPNGTIYNSNMVELRDIGKAYLTSGFKDIIWVVVLFFLILILASILLWVFLSRLHNKEIKDIVENLNTLDEEFDPYSVSKSFGLAYENIKEQFKENLEDYKRLNSYLSHEQKNAISILRTNLEIDGNYEYIKLLDDITDSIDDILTLSDLKEDEKMTEVDVSLVCANVCDTYRKTYKNIEFDFDFERSTTILGKERWIYRAVTNLVTNAIKYGRGSLINVSVKNINKSVIIEVKDKGIGMNKKSIEKIFNDKYRINNLNKDGYGIGLSLVSHVCDLCNGVVVVDSEINKGSCFYLSFSEFQG